MVDKGDALSSRHGGQGRLAGNENAKVARCSLLERKASGWEKSEEESEEEDTWRGKKWVNGR